MWKTRVDGVPIANGAANGRFSDKTLSIVVPVHDPWDGFEKFFLDLPPQIQNVSDPDTDFNEQHFNKLKSYIHNYSIIKELCDETNCTTTNLKKDINEKN